MCCSVSTLQEYLEEQKQRFLSGASPGQLEICAAVFRILNSDLLSLPAQDAQKRSYLSSFNVVVTTYEDAVKELDYLQGGYWQCIIFDDPHRMNRAGVSTPQVCFAAMVGWISRGRALTLLAFALCQAGNCTVGEVITVFQKKRTSNFEEYRKSKRPLKLPFWNILTLQNGDHALRTRPQLGG